MYIATKNMESRLLNIKILLLLPAHFKMLTLFCSPLFPPLGVQSPSDLPLQS